MNCNLSPISKDNLQLIHKNTNLSEEVNQHQDIKNHQVNQSVDNISNIMKPSSQDTNLTQNTLQFAFATSNGSKLAEHLSPSTSKCNNPNFKDLFTHLRNDKFLHSKNNCFFSTFKEYTEYNIDEYNMYKTEEEIDKSSQFSMDDPQSNVKQNKDFREGKICKQCNFIANTKTEYWEHMRCHIKGFTCSKCSFVTKYKHHMNHHWLSVHEGSKPFKCKKCSYTCVSKSMLTSHLKKHSNFYPYRCANCLYKTKFCNALKKHLRKKEHQPAMVLNADGSPNPLSIIDVYGTKRGPKQKPLLENQDESNQSTANNSQFNSASTSPVLSPAQSPITHYLTVTTMNETNDANCITQNSTKQDQSVMTFPYSDDAVTTFDLANLHLLWKDAIFRNNSKLTMKEILKIMEIPEECVQNLPATCFDPNEANKFHNSNNEKASNKSSTIVTLNTQLKSQTDESTDAPLDLRIAEIEKNQFQFQLLATNSSKITSINKRKGKAMKLERHAIMDENIKAEQKEVEFSGSLEIYEPDFCEENQNIKDNKSMADLIDTKPICQYCEIKFGNIFMYTMHMGCHSFENPYKCSMCGQSCTDKFSFFLHIAHSQHT